jgi:hypothetical protein
MISKMTELEMMSREKGYDVRCVPAEMRNADRAIDPMEMVSCINDEGEKFVDYFEGVE